MSVLNTRVTVLQYARMAAKMVENDDATVRRANGLIVFVEEGPDTDLRLAAAREACAASIPAEMVHITVARARQFFAFLEVGNEEQKV